MGITGRHGRRILQAALIASASVAAAGPVAGQEAYRVGLTVSLTGVLADAYASNVEGYRIFFDRLNAAGGINGRRVELLVEDNGSDASRVSVHARKFAQQDRAHVMVTGTASFSYRALMAEAEGSRVPFVIGGGAGCPPEVLPPHPHPWTFCLSAGVAHVDGVVAASLLERLAKQQKVSNAKVGLVALDVPVSRAEVERVLRVGPALGLKVVGTAVVPRGAMDYTPFATQLKDSGAGLVFAWAPWNVESGVFQALDRVGWEGIYLTAIQPPTEADLARIKHEKLHVFYARGLLADGSDGAREILAAAAGIRPRYEPAGWVDAWLGARYIAAGLKECGWPCPGERLKTVFERIVVETGGLTGAPLRMTPDNHFAFSQWRVYRWDAKAGRIVAVTEWLPFPVRRAE
jgi:branched-chain amino acid transport system substrate-binding protein